MNSSCEEEEIIQTKGIAPCDSQTLPGLALRVRSLHGKGCPLPESLSSFFEGRFGRDFEDVRVHADAESARSAQGLNARAYTIGKDIVFGAGQYVPESGEGKRLLAHELVHTIQQVSAGNARMHLQRTIGDGHDLKAERFSGDEDLEAAYDGEKVLGWHVHSGGPAVVKIQQALLDLGYELPLFGADGTFGEETYRAVQAFQRDSGLPFDQVDGRVGPTTMELLDNRFAAGVTPMLPPLTQQQLIDPRIDVGAQAALRRLSQGTAEQRQDAHDMFDAVMNETLKGIYGTDLWVAWRMAQRVRTPQWNLVPPGEDASLVVDPQDARGPYTMFFRQQVRFAPERLDPALTKAWAVTRPSTLLARVKRIDVRKSGQGFRDFEATRGGGLDLGYHTGWQNVFWYANFRFVVDVEVEGDINKCRYIQQRRWHSSLSPREGQRDMFETDMEGFQELNIRPLQSGYWVNVNRSHVMWEDAPGMTTEGRRTRRDLPYELYSDFTQHAIGEDGQEVSVQWGFNFRLDENGNWTRREDNLDVSASHS